MMRRHLRSTGAWKTMPTEGIGPLTTRPSTLIRPAVAGRSPAMMRSSVDLPQPDGPTTATSSPPSTLNVMSRSASTGPESARYVIPTPSRTINASAARPSSGTRW